MSNKKQFNVRLSPEALMGIKIAARERHCSEAEVIESWATGSSGVIGNTVACDAAVAGSSPALPTTDIAPRPTTLEGKKAAAMAALACLRKPRDENPYSGLLEPALNDVPRAPFDLNLEGEPHRVTRMGKRLGLFFCGGGEPVFNRYLAEGELERFWGMRDIK